MGYTLEISFATLGEKGRKNQDNLMIDHYVSSSSELRHFSGYLKMELSEKRLFAVSDGAGGCSRGEAASAMTLDTLYQSLASIKTNPTEPELTRVFDEANRRVAEFYQTRNELGVATLSGLLFEQDRVTVFNAGDSPIYLIQDGILEHISQSHTLSGESGNGKKRAEDNVLTKYIGNPAASGSEMVHQSSISIGHNMIFIIASDGIEKGLPEKKLKKLAMRYEPFVAERLIQQGKKYSASDDITAIVIQVSEDTYIMERE